MGTDVSSGPDVPVQAEKLYANPARLGLGRWREWRLPLCAASRLHFDRTAGSDRNHRDTRCVAAALARPGEGKGPARDLHEQ